MTRTASLFPAAAGAIGGTPEKNGGLDRHYSTTILATCSPNILRQTAAPGTRRSTGSGTGQCRALTWRTDRDPLRPHRSWLELPRAVFERVFRWPAWPYSHPPPDPGVSSRCCGASTTHSRPRESYWHGGSNRRACTAGGVPSTRQRARAAVAASAWCHGCPRTSASTSKRPATEVAGLVRVRAAKENQIVAVANLPVVAVSTTHFIAMPGLTMRRHPKLRFGTSRIFWNRYSFSEILPPGAPRKRVRSILLGAGPCLKLLSRSEVVDTCPHRRALSVLGKVSHLERAS